MSFSGPTTWPVPGSRWAAGGGLRHVPSFVSSRATRPLRAPSHRHVVCRFMRVSGRVRDPFCRRCSTTWWSSAERRAGWRHHRSLAERWALGAEHLRRSHATLSLTSTSTGTSAAAARQMFLCPAEDSGRHPRRMPACCALPQPQPSCTPYPTTHSNRVSTDGHLDRRTPAINLKTRGLETSGALQRNAQGRLVRS